MPTLAQAMKLARQHLEGEEDSISFIESSSRRLKMGWLLLYDSAHALQVIQNMERTACCEFALEPSLVVTD